MLVIIEEHYKMSVWCREILDGLRAEARKKRISLSPSSNISDIRRDGEDPAVIIVGAETEWLNLAVTKAKEAGKHPIILSNQSESELQNGVSRVTEDIFGSMGEILRLFAAKGYQQIALYACNPDSASDSFKKEAFLKSGGLPEDIFTNEGSLSFCFDRFYERYKEKGYGGIVCANDFAAISLIRHLKDKGDRVDDIDIISYSDSLIAKCTSPAVSTVKANFKSFGQLAFLIVDCIAKSENLSGIRFLCNWEILHRETSAPAPVTALPPAKADLPRQGRFYGDEDLMEMMRIETLLSECDETDLTILKMILSQKKLSEIEECSYLTETAVKYRIRKMKETCKTDSRDRLRALLLKYVPNIERLSARCLRENE